MQDLAISFSKLANGCYFKGLILQIPKTIIFKKNPYLDSIQIEIFGLFKREKKASQIDIS